MNTELELSEGELDNLVGGNIINTMLGVASQADKTDQNTVFTQGFYFAYQRLSKLQ